jgi:hypothetical protein
MELWELDAREQIRDVVARYNSNADTARFAQVVELFAPDAVMDLGDGDIRTGHEEIMTVFSGARDRAATTAGPDAPAVYLRHMTATLQIDLVDETNAIGRSYYAVMTSVGLDHWGRYFDTYRVVGGRWRFASRKVTLDGRNPDSIFLGPRG